jgi:glycosyltransferase involved in cell wall biosynthesis
MPMRILQFAAVDETLRFVLPLMKALQASGYQVSAAAQKTSQGPDFASQGIPFFDLPITRKLSIPSIIRALIATIQLLRREHFDAIQAHTYAGGMIGRLAGWLSGVPTIIYTGHGWLYTPQMPRWKQRLIILTERLFKYITDYVFLISKEEYEIGLRDHIVRPDNVVLTLSVGVDCQHFDPKQVSAATRDRIRKEWHLSREEWLFCFVGRLVTEKGLLELGQAFASIYKRHPKARLLMVGTAAESERDQSCKENLLNELTRHCCTEAVIFAGHRSDVRDVLSACDAFVLPTYREGMPVALLEAMAMGLPCVATDIPGCREEVDEGVTGFLVPPKDVAHLENAMRDLIDHPIRAAEMGRLGRKRVIELFSLSKVLPIQLKAYGRIRDINIRNRPPRSRCQEHL